jgi:Arc/MetJ-type ribon-helix-helix transcriptional regulator
MPSTTVHLPDQLLSRIDQTVKEQKISRNRFIIQACEQALNNFAGHWPEGFFDSKLNEQDNKLLKEAVLEMEHTIVSKRKSRKPINL